ncbi:MAG: hypothetical protein U0457_08930 [Candidatus Sericytochromatia bacterium]
MTSTKKLVLSNLGVLLFYIILTKLVFAFAIPSSDGYFGASKFLSYLIPLHLSVLISLAATFMTSKDEEKKLLGKKYAIVSILVLLLGVPSCMLTTLIKF